VNIAATSDGERHCGRRINRKRANDRKLRRKLQQKQTKSAKRRARKYCRSCGFVEHADRNPSPPAIVTSCKPGNSFPGR
jgi:hypothetical protein